MATVRAIQFICRHVLHDQVLNNHTDGKILPVAPNILCVFVIMVNALINGTTVDLSHQIQNKCER